MTSQHRAIIARILLLLVALSAISCCAIASITYHRDEEPHPFLDKLQDGTLQRIQVKENVGFHINYAFQPVTGEGFITRPIDISPITRGIHLTQTLAEYTQSFCEELKTKIIFLSNSPSMKESMNFIFSFLYIFF